MIDKDVRRFLLRPLSRRRNHAIGKEYLKALAALDERALGEMSVRRLRAKIGPRKSGKGKAGWNYPERATRFVDLAKALYASRRISRQEYIFYALVPVEGIHETRWLDGAYDAQLRPIISALDAIRKQHGLGPDQDWLRGEGPAEYVQLQTQYEAVLDRKFIETLGEFGLEDLIKLREENLEEFDKLSERGRRSVFHRDEFAQAIRDVVLRYENEAKQAADAGAYSAAIICLGAGIEGLLLLRCLRSKSKAKRVSRSLRSRVRPRSDDPSKWTFETLIEVCLAAGWLSPVETPFAKYNVASLAHVLRQMRNYVHPVRRVREQPWSQADERDYQDANAIYVILLSILGKIPGRQQT